MDDVLREEYLRTLSPKRGGFIKPPALMSQGAMRKRQKDCRKPTGVEDTKETLLQHG